MYTVRRIVRVAVLGLGIAWLLSAPAAGDPGRSSVVSTNIGAHRVEWLPTVAYKRLVLTTVGPEGFVDRQELEAGQSPSLSLFKPDGEPLPDGLYRYELWLLPHASGRLTENTVQRGAFWVRDGRFVTPDPPESSIDSLPAPSTPSQIRNITGEDSVIPDDLVVQGTACIGPNCVNGDPDSRTLKLKGPTPRILFDDPAGFGCCYPATDWVLQANTSDPPTPDFFLQEAFSGNIPFSVHYNAPSYTLVVAGGTVSGVSESRVGIGTQVPLQSLHALSPATPTLRLEKTVSPGPARTWDVGANQTSFFVRDVTNSSSVPFQIGAGAPSNSLFIASNGRVGIGTATPGAAQLHVYGVATTDVSGGLGPDPASGPAFNFGYAGASFGRGAGFLNVRPDASAAAPNPSLRFLTANVERMIIDNEGFIGLGVANPTSPIHHSSGALLTAGGVWQNASSRESKQDIAKLAADEAIATLQDLEPVKFAYKVDPQERHVGFIAEDVPDLLAASDRKSLSPMDVVAVLTKVVQEQQKTIDELSTTIGELRTKINEIEKTHPEPSPAETPQ